MLLSFNDVEEKMSFFTHTFSAWGKTCQLTFICSKSVIETLEKGVKYVQI